MSFARSGIFWRCRALPWAGPGRRSGHLSARSVGFRICRSLNAGQTGTASRRLPLSRLHLLSRIGVRLNKFDSFGARASSLHAIRHVARRRGTPSSFADAHSSGFGSLRSPLGPNLYNFLYLRLYPILRKNHATHPKMTLPKAKNTLPTVEKSTLP